MQSGQPSLVIGDRPSTPPDAVVAEVIDENSRLNDQNRQLKTRSPPAALAACLHGVILVQ